jgi:hypothetical protein
MMIEQEKQVVGQRVCITGQGTDRPVHRHSVIKRVTKTMIVVESGRRFNRDGRNDSIPYSPYGGTEVHATCQRPGQAQF